MLSENREYTSSFNGKVSITNEREDLNDSFLGLVEYLTSLQVKIRNSIEIDDKGRINRSKSQEVIKTFQNIGLINKMDKLALEYYKSIKNNLIGTTDCLIIGGALVCIYDSSKVIPTEFRDTSRGVHRDVYMNGIYISLIGIDINQNHRQDGVLATTSLHHEFQHHINTTLGDQFLSESSVGNFKTLKRFADPPNGFKSKSQFLATEEEKYSLLFGRKVTFRGSHPGIKTQDYLNYEGQLHYLDELSASFGQAKSRVFGPNLIFYNNIGKEDTHYNLIGNSDTDKEKLKILFRDYLMPGLYLFQIRKSILEEISSINAVIAKNDIEDKIKNAKTIDAKLRLEKLDYLISLITQTIGISRTINQALELIKIIWQKRILPSLSDNQLIYINEGGKQLHKYL